MYCSHCGKELRTEAAFCVYCGTPIGRQEPFGELLAQPRASNKTALIIVGICVGVGVLMLFLLFLALLLPAVFAAREAASRMMCANHEKQIGIAFHNYHDSYGALPPLYTVDEDGKPLHSWRVLILPFIEQQEMYRQIRLDEPWDSDHNRQFHDRMPSIYKCPSHPGNPRSDCTYSAVAGWAFVPAKEAESVLGVHFRDLIEGTSNILALVEVKEAFNWMDPTADVTLEDIAKGNRIGSNHSNFVNVLMMDCSVQALTWTELLLMAAHKVEEKEKEVKSRE